MPQHSNVLIVTDVDEEIDDQCCLDYLFRQMRSAGSGTMWILLAGGKPVDPCQLDRISQQRLRSFRHYFPWAGIEDSFLVGDWTVTLLSTGQLRMRDWQHPGVRMDVMLQIAPLCGIHPEFFHAHPISKRVLMGDWQYPSRSINCSKLWFGELDAARWDSEREAQEQAMCAGGVNPIWSWCDTAMARRILFTPAIISNLDPRFKELVMDKTFSQFVQRISPTAPYCLSVTKGANLVVAVRYIASARGRGDEDALQALERFSRRVDGDPLVPGSSPVDPDLHARAVLRIREATNAFVNQMALHDVGERQSAERTLSMMAWVVFAVTGQLYAKPTAAVPNVFQLAHLQYPEQAKSSWMAWVDRYSCSITPCYDLAAGCIAWPLIMGDSKALKGPVKDSDVEKIAGILESPWGEDVSVGAESVSQG